MYSKLKMFIKRFANGSFVSGIAEGAIQGAKINALGGGVYVG